MRRTAGCTWQLAVVGAGSPMVGGAEERIGRELLLALSNHICLCERVCVHLCALLCPDLTCPSAPVPFPPPLAKCVTSLRPGRLLAQHTLTSVSTFAKLFGLWQSENRARPRRRASKQFSSGAATWAAGPSAALRWQRSTCHHFCRHRDRPNGTGPRQTAQKSRKSRCSIC